MNNLKRLPLIAAAVFLLNTSALALEVIPSGECVGVKLYTDGLVVVDTSAVTGTDGTEHNPAKDHGIAKGDIIKSINGIPAESNEMLANEIARHSGEEITLTVCKNGKDHDVTLTPPETDAGPRLGLWLRDSTAGLGTITCTLNDRFAALGHGICDVDTGNIMPVGRGIIQECTICTITAGGNGAPGAITGSIDGAELGSININSDNGLFGTLTQPYSGSAVEVAEKQEVRTGAASILADVDGEGVKEYSIEIKRISPPLFGTKDMVVKVTDDTLIQKTGGIVQGMSGAPILQNNKLVGAVTHVFVNDSLSGYAILAEHMLKNWM